jgi:hypothetical protein
VSRLPQHPPLTHGQHPAAASHPAVHLTIYRHFSIPMKWHSPRCGIRASLGCQSKKEVRGAAWPDSLRPRVSKYYGSRSKRPLNVVVVAYELRESQHHRLNSHTLSILTRSQSSHALNPHDPRTPSILTSSILTRRQSSHVVNPHTSSILTRRQSSHVVNPHTPSIFACPHFSLAPHLSRGWTLVSANLPPTALNIRHLQLPHAGLRIEMEDDVLRFPEGVLVDDIIEAGLVGIVAL